MAALRQNPVGMRALSHRDFPLERVRALAGPSVSVCLPARNEAATIGGILAALAPLRDAGVVDQIAVVDDSTDGTAEIARSLGAEVYDQRALVPELGPVLGKGDAMWRSLRVLRGDIICFLDADTENFAAHFALGLIGPLLADPQLSFVKAHYRRPFRMGEITLPDGGGRVTELLARPLLRLFYPELAGVRQPLAGEVAARRQLLERVPFVTGYGVDIALLIDAYRTTGPEAIAQVDLEVRQNSHQPLRDLGPMADEVLGAVVARLAGEGRSAAADRLPFPAGREGRSPGARGWSPGEPAQLDPEPVCPTPPPVERPPLAALRPAA